MKVRSARRLLCADAVLRKKSLPDIQRNIARSQAILVRGLNFTGKEVHCELSGLIARVIQHAINHLNGVLIIDYASTREKLSLRRPMKDWQQQYKGRRVVRQNDCRIIRPQNRLRFNGTQCRVMQHTEKLSRFANTRGKEQS